MSDESTRYKWITRQVLIARLKIVQFAEMNRVVTHISDYVAYSYQGKIVVLIKDVSLVDNEHGVAVSWDRVLRVFVGLEEYSIPVNKTMTLFALWNINEDVNILYVHDWKCTCQMYVLRRGILPVLAYEGNACGESFARLDDTTFVAYRQDYLHEGKSLFRLSNDKIEFVGQYKENLDECNSSGMFLQIRSAMEFIVK